MDDRGALRRIDLISLKTLTGLKTDGQVLTTMSLSALSEYELTGLIFGRN